MADLAQLQAWKAALEAARYAGERSVQYHDQKVEYRTDAEMRVALADLNRQMDAVSGTPRVSMIRTSSSKGI